MHRRGDGEAGRSLSLADAQPGDRSTVQPAQPDAETCAVAAEAIVAELRQRTAELRASLEGERARAKAAERVLRERDAAIDEALRRLGELRTERRPWLGLRAWWRRVRRTGG